MFESIRNFFKDDRPSETDWQEKGGVEKGKLPLKELNRCLNIFIAGHRLKVGEEFTQAVLDKANVSDEELDDLIIAANNGTPKNNVESLRRKIVDAVVAMDVKENI